MGLYLLSLAGDQQPPAGAVERPVAWACPRCGTTLRGDDAMLACPQDGLEYPRTGGTWRLLAPERARELAPFIEAYQKQRAGENWGSSQAEYYLGLPYNDLTGRHESLWRLRARHMERLVKILAGVLARPGALVLDAGAGNCWLSYRLAERGARAIAIDLNDDTIDGLGVAEVYRARAGVSITTAQAELERMPLEAGQCDAVVINGSLHYAANVPTVLAESRRVLRPGGGLAVMDSPVYHDEQAGEMMMAEWAAQYTASTGSAPSRIPGRGFLTYREVEQGLVSAGFRRENIRLWRQYTGLRAAWHYARTRLAPTGAARRRETATHPMWVATREV